MQSFSNILNMPMHPVTNSNGSNHHYANCYASSSSTSSATSSGTSKSSNMNINVNNSFIKDLIDLNITSERSLQQTSPKIGKSLQQHQHHHHSIQELIRHFGKKVPFFRGNSTGDNYRRNSCSISENKQQNGNVEEEFRVRSKSLDCSVKRPLISDCEATYRIYDRILLEGMFEIVKKCFFSLVLTL